MDAVIKVECMHTEPNFSLPWQRKRQYPSSSTAFVISQGGQLRLLTNAHSVDYHTQVRGVVEGVVIVFVWKEGQAGREGGGGRQLAGDVDR